jgi:hypothetical protein
MRRWLTCLVLAAWAPTCAASSKSGDRTSKGDWESRANSCRSETGCGASGLPRVTEQDWSPAEVTAFVERAGKGTVAVDWRDGRVRLLATCRLDGAYLEIKGKTGSGRMWVTNRPLFRTDEVGGDCAEGNHEVAAYSRAGNHFEAILVPLPCPPVADAEPARGCLGRGMTGSQRIKKSEPLMVGLAAARESHSSPDRAALSAGRILDMWALAPDEYHAAQWLAGLPDDCGFRAHGVWVSSVYYWDATGGRARTGKHATSRAAPEFALAQSADDCLFRPPFLDCFPRLFEAAHDGGACWSPAEKGRVL